MASRLPNSPPGRKQQSGKKVLSCAECRRLKIKCDLEFPCRHCIKRNLGHICPGGEIANGSRKMNSLVSIDDMKARISNLELALQESCPEHPLLETAMFKRNATRSGEPSPESPAGSSTQTSYGRLIIGDSPDVSRYYGSASSAYLAKTTVPKPRDLPHSPPTIDETFPNLFSPFQDPGPGIDIHKLMSTTLPDEATARQLSFIYFETIAWWTNVVPFFTWDDKIHHHIYRKDGPPNPQRLALFFLVLALGVLMDLSRPTKDPLAKLYFSAAHKCLAADPSHSVVYVQCIYLVGVYLMNGGSENVGGDNFWPLLRTGCAIAEAIGLHRDGSHWNLDETSVKERECVFWSIYAFDVVQSVALGRGQCIARNRIDCRIPEGNGDETGFFYWKNVFMGIASRVNDLLVRIHPATHEEVARLDDAITTFEHALPLHLSSAEPPNQMELQDHQLKLRAFHRAFALLYINETRLALHRPFFVRALSEFSTEPLESPYKRSFIGCIEAARSIVTLVGNMVLIHGPLLERRWHFVFHLFSACACLAACAIRAKNSMMARTVISDLDRGVAIFKQTGRGESETISRLRDKAWDAVRYGRSVGGSVEDLDLIGARTTTAKGESRIDKLLIGNGNPFDFQQMAMDNGLLQSTEFDLEAFLRDCGSVLQ